MKKLVERLNYNKVITLKLIVPSNGCNARCRFCYMKSYGKNSTCLDKQLFLDNFIISMTTLLDKINGRNPVSLDITGNEPTLDISLFRTILEKLKSSNLKSRFCRVTLTTNAVNMKHLIDACSNFVDYVNISIHSFDIAERLDIMKYSLTDNEYSFLTRALNEHGITVSAIAVIDKPRKDFDGWRNKFIEWCKSNGFIALRFRCDVFSKNTDYFDEYMLKTMSNKQFSVLVHEKTTDSHWCRLRMNDRFRVFFLHGVLDTSKVNRGIEYVIHTDGKCYCDFYKQIPIETVDFEIGKIYDIIETRT